MNVSFCSPLASARASLRLAAWILPSVVCVTVAFASAMSQAPSTQESQQLAVIDALLKMPAPPPDWREHLKKRKETPPSKPPNDAPIAALVDYWGTAPETEVPDDVSRARLLEACETAPEEIPALLPRLALDSADVQDRLKKLYDRLVGQRRREDMARGEMLRAALMTHSRYFRDELVRRVFFPDDVNERDFLEATSAFVRLEPEDAKQLFLKESTSSDLMHRVLALSNLRSHFATEAEPSTATAWLNELKRIANDPKSAKRPRGFALTSVMSAQTSENDEWFLDLFRDRTLQKVEQYSSRTTLLADVVAERPDYWVPKIVPLVASKDPAIHTNAVLALIQFQIDRARADALRPLLPWLENPKWSPEVEEIRGRLRLIQSLDRVDLPEAVPGLLKVVETASEYELASAADALAHYNARQAGEPLKRALKREKKEYHRWAITRALVKLGALSVEEMVEALKLYATKISTTDGRKEVDDADELLPEKQLDPRVSMGKELARTDLSDDALSATLLAEAEALATSSPATADILRQLVAQWQTPSATTAMVDRLRRGDLTAEWVKQLIERRTRVAAPLAQVRELHHAALGVQAALTTDAATVNHVLSGGNRLAQLALLAVARMARVDLPVAPIARWLTSEDKTLARAADLYLEANDSPEARRELWRRALGAARILGARWWFDPGHVTFGAFDETEKKLRDLVLREKGPQTIYALLSEGYWGGDGQRVLVVENGKTILRGDDGNGRTRECEVPAAEMKSLVDWLERERVEDLPPFDTGTADGIQWEFVRLNRDGGRRIFMNNPPYGGGTPRVEFAGQPQGPEPAIYGELTRRFTKLTERSMRVVYRTLAELPGYQVVHAREKGEVVAIRREKGALSVGIRLPSEEATAWHRVSESGLAKDFEVQKAEEKWWAKLSDNGDGVEVHEGPAAGRRLQPVWSSDGYAEGLWALQKSGKDELIAKGTFARPVVCPGGEWIVVAKTPPGEMWNVPNGVVRIHIPDKRSIPVDLPSADWFQPILWLDSHHRVLLYQQRERQAGYSTAGPEEAEFYLLEPESGRYEKVEGEFRPFFDAEKQALQPTGKANEVWAVLHPNKIDPKQESNTTIGRFDTQNFAFKPLLICTDMFFESSDIFVDEAVAVIWLVVNGDLLRLSLPSTSPPNK